MWLVMNHRKYTIKNVRKIPLGRGTEIKLVLDRPVDLSAMGHVTASSESYLVGYSMSHCGGTVYKLTDLV